MNPGNWKPAKETEEDLHFHLNTWEWKDIVDIGGTSFIRRLGPQEKPVQGPSFSARLNTMQGNFRNLKEVNPNTHTLHLPKTNTSPSKIRRAPKGNDRLENHPFSSVKLVLGSAHLWAKQSIWLNLFMPHVWKM